MREKRIPGRGIILSWDECKKQELFKLTRKIKKVNGYF